MFEYVPTFDERTERLNRKIMQRALSGFINRAFIFQECSNFIPPYDDTPPRRFGRRQKNH